MIPKFREICLLFRSTKDLLGVDQEFNRYGKYVL